ncbi:MAG: DUF5816 domain-containing protein [Haloplanus sp.]
MDRRTAPDGTAVVVDSSTRERGSKAPFFVAYLAADHDRRWGLYCDNCDSLDTAMDPMGRVECNACGNVRKPDRWDAAHE